MDVHSTDLGNGCSMASPVKALQRELAQKNFAGIVGRGRRTSGTPSDSSRYLMEHQRCIVLIVQSIGVAGWLQSFAY